jgi:glycosyltransferase involved in cell wall biosynthesis
MKIAYTYPAFINIGGADKIIINKANYMAEKMRYDVYLITDSQNGLKPFFPVSDKVKMIDLDINFFQQYQYSPLKRFWVYRRLTNLFKQRMSKLLAEIRPDILISTFSRDAKFVNLYKRYAKATIAEVHTTKKNIRALPELRRKGFPYTLLADYIEHELDKSAKQFDEVIVLNNLEKELWAPVRNVRVINNAVQIYPKETNLLSAKSAIFVGRAEYEKGPDRLIEVWKLVAERHPDWTVKMFCTGAMLNDLQAKVKEYGLEEQLLFMPPTKDMEHEYMTSSLCLMTSRFEGFPVVLQEAMGCGLPCLSFNCPSGPRYIIKDQEDGYLVENGNLEAMAEHVCELIENVELRKKLGQKAKENMAYYSEERIMGQWKVLFEDLVNRANHGK